MRTIGQIQSNGSLLIRFLCVGSVAVLLITLIGSTSLFVISPSNLFSVKLSTL